MTFYGADLDGHGLELVQIAMAGIFRHGSDAPGCEKDHQQRESEEQGKVEEKLGAVPEKQDEAADEEDPELTEPTRQGRWAFFGRRDFRNLAGLVFGHFMDFHESGLRIANMCGERARRGRCQGGFGARGQALGIDFWIEPGPAFLP